MQTEDDVQLIHRILSGDDEAFNLLVRRYEKSIHARVWQKIGDFHHAEEITQDIFLQAYKKLSTLKDPNQFAGWLYAVENRLCIDWMRKQKPTMQSLENTPVRAIDNLTYECYVSEQQESEATECRYETVEKLLAKLPENERTVMMLYYLSEMTAKEIGKSLGVSVNTIRSRLHRARRRLQADQELLIQEFLGSVQITDLEVCGSRWRLIARMFSEADAKKTIPPEIESLMRIHPETSEVLHTAYRGYISLPGGIKNVPNSLFDKMLQYPKTEAYLSALLGLAERSEEACQKWHHYQRVINECTISDGPSSWYWGAYERMLRLAEEDRSLASDDYLDGLIDRFLQVHLAYCQETQQYFGWAYTEAVKYRLKFNIRLDKALETLEHAETRLGEEEEQRWLVEWEQKWLIEPNKEYVEKAYKEISRLRAEISFRQERWREAHDGLLANIPDYLESLSERFSKDTINYFYMLGRSAEEIGERGKARRYYTDAHFAPTPHAEARAGLERIHHQIERRSTDTFEVFLKDAEVEYRSREETDREKIRQNLITNRLNKKATDFRLQTWQGETYTLSAMSGKIVLLEIGDSHTKVHNRAIPEVKLVYERFSKNGDVVVWGINDDINSHQVRKFIDGHHVPWPILLDPHGEVRKAYQIIGIPCCIVIDKVGNWQYICRDLDAISGQPLIWMIEALLSD